MHHRGRDEDARSLLGAAQAFWNTRPDRFLGKLSASRTLQARLERQQGKPDAAIATLEQSIREFRTLRGTPDADAAYALVSLSITLAQVGRVEEALARADASVTEYTQLGKADSVEGLTALGNRAAIASMLGRDESALADMREVSAKLVVFGASEGLAKADTQLGELLAKLGRFDEALPILRSALAMAVQYGGEDGRLAAGVRQRLAQACLDANRDEEAEPLVDKMLEHARTAYGEDSRDSGIAYRLRAQLRATQHRSDEALADLARAEDIFRAMGKNGERQLAKIDELRIRIKDSAPASATSSRH
jgi:tetratricopeptide (TPR) repeat protein